MAATRKKDDLKEQAARIVIQAALPYLAGWIQTLGELGAPKGKGKVEIDPRSRVSAAKTGVDFVTKFIGEAGASAAGSELMKELRKIDRAADPDGATRRDRAEDPLVGSEDADLDEGGMPDGADPFRL